MNKITVLVLFLLSLMTFAVSAVEKKCPEGTTWNAKLKGCVENINSRPAKSGSVSSPTRTDS